MTMETSKSHVPRGGFSGPWGRSPRSESTSLELSQGLEAFGWAGTFCLPKSSNLRENDGWLLRNMLLTQPSFLPGKTVPWCLTIDFFVKHSFFLAASKQDYQYCNGLHRLRRSIVSNPGDWDILGHQSSGDGYRMALSFDFLLHNSIRTRGLWSTQTGYFDPSWGDRKKDGKIGNQEKMQYYKVVPQFVS